MSPMFRTEQFGQTSPYANTNANINMIKGLNELEGNFSSNHFDTPQGRFGTNSSESNLESNSIARISSKYENLKKLNDVNYNKDRQESQTTNNSIYKNVADDWSHSIYLLNINPNTNNQIKQMNTCK